MVLLHGSGQQKAGKKMSAWMQLESTELQLTLYINLRGREFLLQFLRQRPGSPDCAKRFMILLHASSHHVVFALPFKDSAWAFERIPRTRRTANRAELFVSKPFPKSVRPAGLSLVSEVWEREMA